MCSPQRRVAWVPKPQKICFDPLYASVQKHTHTHTHTHTALFHSLRVTLSRFLSKEAANSQILLYI